MTPDPRFSLVPFEHRLVHGDVGDVDVSEGQDFDLGAFRRGSDAKMTWSLGVSRSPGARRNDRVPQITRRKGLHQLHCTDRCVFGKSLRITDHNH